MSTSPTQDRLLFSGVVVVLAASVVAVLWSAILFRDRQIELSEVALERTQQMLRVRLDGMFHEFREDLREEAAAIAEHDTMRFEHALERWRPLLHTHWSITAVRLADEHGNELTMARVDTGLVLLLTKDGSAERGPRAFQVIDRDTLPMLDASTYLEGTYDPRTSIWFSKALESARREPVWSLRDIDAPDRTGLFVSHLIRGRTDRTPFRILVFHIDIGLSPWVDVRSSPLHQFGALLLDDAGRMLNIPDERKDPLVIGAEEAAVQAWKASQTSSPFPIDHADRHFRAIISAYYLNGLTLYTGTLMDVELIARWMDTEKRGIMVAAILLLLIIFLLAWMWIRRKHQVESIRRQEKYSRSQERKLAKALGEREVLNREVHHRVKNNLQVVSSLLNLQANRQENDAVRTEFMRGKQRIDIIALVHHKLYGMQDLRRVDLKLFFTALIDQLAMMHATMSSTISCELDTGRLRADQDTAIELGIILCELVSNCYQHAFPYATGGHIEISVQAMEGDLYRLLVKDNGKGLADSYADGPGKLGLEIVDALAGQLDGSFHTRTNGGTTFEVLFRMKPAPVSPEAGGTQAHSVDQPTAGL